MAARYIAERDGLLGTHYVRAGEAFEFEGPKPGWAEEVRDERGEMREESAERKTGASSSKSSGGKKPSSAKASAFAKAAADKSEGKK